MRLRNIQKGLKWFRKYWKTTLNTLVSSYPMWLWTNWDVETHSLHALFKYYTTDEKEKYELEAKSVRILVIFF